MNDRKPLTEQLQSLINYANETTGKSDAKLSDAIQSLVDGFGTGGGDGGSSTIIKHLTYTPEVDETIGYAINKMNITLPNSGDGCIFFMIARNLYSIAEFVQSRSLVSFFDWDGQDTGNNQWSSGSHLKGVYFCSNAYGFNSSTQNWESGGINTLKIENNVLSSYKTDNEGASSTYNRSYLPQGQLYDIYIIPKGDYPGTQLMYETIVMLDEDKTANESKGLITIDVDNNLWSEKFIGICIVEYLDKTNIARQNVKIQPIKTVTTFVNTGTPVSFILITNRMGEAYTNTGNFTRTQLNNIGVALTGVGQNQYIIGYRNSSSCLASGSYRVRIYKTDVEF